LLSELIASLFARAERSPGSGVEDAANAGWTNVNNSPNVNNSAGGAPRRSRSCLVELENILFP
jgi:hypothetical protein